MAIRRICRIEVTDFRGITESRLDVPRNGLKFSGDEGTGKTSHLDAIATALRGHDLGVDVIRRGAEKTTLLVRFDDGTTVKRSVTAKGVGQPTVQVEGMRATSPQTWLNERLGLSAFDVISFIGAKPVDRVRMLQAAIPCTVTIERLREWVPTLEEFDCSGHGLDVVKRLHKVAYDRRTAANAAAKTANTDLERAAQEAMRANEGIAADAFEPAEALDRQRKAEQHASTLLAAVKEAQAHEARTAGTREQIAKIREQADARTRSEAEWTAAGVKVESEQANVLACSATVTALEAQLAAARRLTCQMACAGWGA